jgi:hypothetical protein
MITAHLVGVEEALSRLRAIPETADIGLARAITKLGIDLQRNIQQNEFTGRSLTGRFGSLSSNVDLSFDQTADGVAATVSRARRSRAGEQGFTGRSGLKDNLRHVKKRFERPALGKMVTAQARNRRTASPDSSFLRSALEEMTPSIRDEVEAALSEAVKG